MEHVLFNNFVTTIGENIFLLLNLTSFRRKRITISELQLLESAWRKSISGESLKDDEYRLVQKLYNEKQILSKENEAQYFSWLEEKNREIISPFPVRALTFNITHQCNFTCNYCYQRSYNKLPEYAGRMNLADIDAIAQYLQSPFFFQTEVNNITISGGEPLLPGNEAVISHIIDKFPAKEIVLFTNGVNIDRFKSRLDFSRFTKFQVSLDGPNETIYSINHSSENIRTVLNGIDYLLSLGKTVSLAVMWTRSLEQNLEPFISIIEETGFCSNRRFSVGITSVKDYSNKETLDKNFYDWDYLFECEKKYSRVLSRIGATFTVSSEIDRFRRVLFRPPNEQITPMTICCNVEKTIPVTFEPNGEVHWCACLGSEGGIIGNYKSGILFEERIKSLANRNIFTIQQCRECPYKYICGGGCVLNNIGSNSSVGIPFCSVFSKAFILNRMGEYV